MTVLRVGNLVDAPLPAVRQALADPTVWRRVARAAGGMARVERVSADGTDLPENAPLQTGDVLVLSGPARPDPLLRGEARYRVERDGDGLPRLRHPVAGSVTLRTDATGAGVLVELEFDGPRRGPAGVAVRRRAIRVGELLTSVVLLQAHDAPVVVAGLLTDELLDRGGDSDRPVRVLAALRPPGGPSGGRWELPGGKVELGETEPMALQRELREELGVEVEVGHRLVEEVELGGGAVLRTYRCRTREEPRGLEHTELRWLAVEELDQVDWLDGDAALLTTMAAELGRRPRWSAAGGSGR